MKRVRKADIRKEFEQKVADQAAQSAKLAEIQADLLARFGSAPPMKWGSYTATTTVSHTKWPPPKLPPTVSSAAMQAMLSRYGLARTPLAGEMLQLAEPLPVTRDDMPILAHRAAYLRPGPGGFRLESMHFGPIPMEGDAVCKCDTGMFGDPLRWRSPDKPEHEVCPPDRGACGFYAVPADKKANSNWGTVDLLVELSGRVVEHEEGYRAQHQKVVEVRMKPECHVCGAETSHYAYSQVNSAGFCLCSEDARHTMDTTGAYPIAFDRLTEVLGVRVSRLPVDFIG